MADPGLVASALDATAVEDGKLFPDRWLIVTSDRAVAAIADQHNVSTIQPADLGARIDAALR
jgi:hypothetical protein